MNPSRTRARPGTTPSKPIVDEHDHAGVIAHPERDDADAPAAETKADEDAQHATPSSPKRD
jgi:hypothetical protein